MPPLTTPAIAVLFMVTFFAAMMGLPLLVLRLAHHRPPHILGITHKPQERYKLILPE
jgi:hypothetical protein